VWTRNERGVRPGGAATVGSDARAPRQRGVSAGAVGR
jgi:hypothetical protein